MNILVGVSHLEVRCCCQPQKLLGYLPLHGTKPAIGARVTWTIQRAGWYWRVRSALGAVRPGERPFEFEPVTADTLTLEIREAWIRVDDHVTEARLAFYSEETPLERLQQVPGFVDADA